jgi:hypothetical protein
VSSRRPDDEIEPGQPWRLEPPGRDEPLKGGRRRLPPAWILVLLAVAMLIALVALLLGAGQ